MLTFVVGVAAIAALVLVWRFVRRSGAPRRLVALAAAPLLGVVAQPSSAGSPSSTDLSPATVAAHFLVSMVLVAASTVLYLAVGRATRAAACAARSVQLGWASFAGSRPSCSCSAPSSRARARTRATPRSLPASGSTRPP
jgi:cytochrome c oxidase assembly protein subunit 15